MISQEVVAAKPREGKFNKNAARRVRVSGQDSRRGLWCGGAGGGRRGRSQADLADSALRDSGHNTIFDVEVTGSTAKAKAMIVDWQYEPIKDTLIHIDLKRIALDKAMQVEVPIKLIGIPVGVKTAGRHSRPGAARSGDRVPAGAIFRATSIVDVTNMSIGDVLRVSRSAALGQDQVPDRRGRDRGPRGLDQGRGCACGRSSGCGCRTGRAGSGQEGQDRMQPRRRLRRARRSKPWRLRQSPEHDSPSRGLLLVVGLGNPGIEYQLTPHNAGFLAIDRIAEQEGVVVANRRCRALTAKMQIAGREVILAKPETFMNLSGLSVAALVGEFEIDPARDLLVMYDELDLPLGVVRVRERGSPAGHNGARSHLRSAGHRGVAAHPDRSGLQTRERRRGIPARQGLPADADAQDGSGGAGRGAGSGGAGSRGGCGEGNQRPR